MRKNSGRGRVCNVIDELAPLNKEYIEEKLFLFQQKMDYLFIGFYLNSSYDEFLEGNIHHRAAGKKEL